MALSDLISTIKRFYKLTNDDLDTVITDFINEDYRTATRKWGWKELIVEGATLSLTAGDGLYNLATDFFRMVPDGVRVFQDGMQQGLLLKEVPQSQVGIYESLTLGTGSSANYYTLPVAYAIIGISGSTNLQIQLLPAFTQTGLTLNYDYYRRTDTYVDASAVTVLNDYLVYSALLKLAVYFDDKERIATYGPLARQHLLAAFTQTAGG